MLETCAARQKSVARFDRADSAVADAVEAANRAAAAFPDWSKTSAEDRLKHLARMSEALDDRRAELRVVAAEEVGAGPAWVDFNIEIAREMLAHSAGLVPLMRDESREDEARRTRSILRRRPVGVVLGIAPWNAPIALAARAIAAPLVCGNAVVLKASEHCPETHLLLVAILNDVGLPEGVVRVAANPPDLSEAVVETLLAHPAIRRVNFTGSTRVGRQVARMAARHLKRCLLELSGKAPLIVLEDANLDVAASAAAFGTFFNQGQICISTERIIVLESVADAFVERLLALARELRAADPREEEAPLGAMINSEAAARVRRLIDDAVSKGARLLAGGEVAGAVMQPAIVDGVAAHMALYHEESFGPVASVLRVADEEAAVSIANDTDFGLAAAVHSADEARAMRIVDRLETGIAHINGPTVYDDPAMPFGGMKASGYGRFGGPASLDEFTELRWIARHDRPLVPPPFSTANLHRKEMSCGAGSSLNRP